MKPIPQEDFRSIIRNEFELRRLRRPTYSFRAFSRDLGMEPSRLTAVMKGRYGLSAVVAKTIAEKLHFSADQASYFIDLVESKHARTALAREQAAKRLNRKSNSVNFQPISEEKLDLLSKWYYSAILEMFEVNSSIGPNELAVSLRISRAEVDEGIRLLLQNGVLTKVGNEYKANSDYLMAYSQSPKPAIKTFHAEILDQVKSAIVREPVENRKNLSTVFSFDSSQTDAAREWLVDMHDQFFKKFGSAGKSDSVMALGVHLVPLNERPSK